MKALFVFLFMSAASVGARAAVVFDTGNGLLSVCDKDYSYCLGASAGYYDMLQSMGETCAGIPVTNRQAADIVVKFLRDHPADRHLSAVSLARVALMDAFPCPKG